MLVRDETRQDAAAIAELVTSAFAGAPHGGGHEAAIVAALRRAGAQTVSLVAQDDAGVLVGHVAFSPVTIAGEVCGWFGLGPVAVAPARQRRGVGAALIRDGLERLRAMAARGCVVLGEPAYYARFGFRSGAGLIYPGPPREYFQSLAFAGEHPCGEVAYHPAFG